MHDSSGSAFDAVTDLETARERFRELVRPHGRTTARPVVDAVGAVLADPVTAERAVPHYERAAMDGYAVRAADTQQAGRSPAVLAHSTAAVGQREAVDVHTGSALPEGADAVVMVEETRDLGDEIEVQTAVTSGENVAPVGEDVADGQHLYDAGHRLTPADLGLLRSAGIDAVTVADRPRVSVIPTGEELVPADEEPAPGQVVETNGLVVSELVERWGGAASYRDIVTDDVASLTEAVERDTDHDLVVTTGGTSVGDRDLLPEVVGDSGEVVVHGIAIKPGHPAGFGTVAGTPVLLLPGYPVSCLVVATQLLRPAIAASSGTEADPIPTTTATLDRKLHSEPGVRSFARVRLEDGRAIPVRSSGAGVLSSATLSDGWVVVPDALEGYAAGEEVAVEHWDWWP